MKCLAQGYNTAPLVRFEPTVLRSRAGPLATELLVLPHKTIERQVKLTATSKLKMTEGNHAAKTNVMVNLNLAMFDDINQCIHS